MNNILSSVFNPQIVEQAGSEAMVWFVFTVSIVAVYVCIAMFFDLLNRKKPRYIVSKNFLKLEDRTKKDLTKWEGKIEVTHNYYDGPLFVQK